MNTAAVLRESTEVMQFIGYASYVYHNYSHVPITSNDSI